ncbi:MAG: YceI family protein, partial [Bacteroidota bacterium]
MNKTVLILLFGLVQIGQGIAQSKYIARQGQLTFFSYTSVENIEASNNQVFSIVDLEKEALAASMLMRAFVFKKALMQEHFNESCMESDIYPKASFEGNILDFDISLPERQTRIIDGKITIRGITQAIKIKTDFEHSGDALVVSGSFMLNVADF